MGADGRSLHRIELCKLVRGGIRREDAVESLILSGFFGGNGRCAVLLRALERQLRGRTDKMSRKIFDGFCRFFVFEDGCNLNAYRE